MSNTVVPGITEHFPRGGTSEKEYPPPHHLPLSYILECKDTTYNNSIIFNTLMNADNLIIKLNLVKEKNTLSLELVN